MDKLFIENTNSCSRGLPIAFLAIDYLINNTTFLQEAHLEEGWGKKLAYGLGGLGLAGLGAAGMAMSDPEGAGNLAHSAGLSDETSANIQNLANQGKTGLSNIANTFTGNTDQIQDIHSKDVTAKQFADAHKAPPAPAATTGATGATAGAAAGTPPTGATGATTGATGATTGGAGVTGATTGATGATTGGATQEQPKEPMKFRTAEQIDRDVNGNPTEIRRPVSNVTLSAPTQNNSANTSTPPLGGTAAAPAAAAPVAPVVGVQPTGDAAKTAQPAPQNSSLPTDKPTIAQTDEEKDAIARYGEGYQGIYSSPEAQAKALGQSGQTGQMGPTGNDDSAARAQRVTAFKASQEAYGKQPENLKDTVMGKYGVGNMNSGVAQILQQNPIMKPIEIPQQQETQPQEENPASKPASKSTSTRAGGGPLAGNEKFAGSQYDRGRSEDVSGKSFTYAKTSNLNGNPPA